MQAERARFELAVDVNPLRFSRPDESCGKDILVKDLETVPSERCTVCCTILSESPFAHEIAAIASAWPNLSDLIRQAIMTLVTSTGEHGKGSSHV